MSGQDPYTLTTRAEIGESSACAVTPPQALIDNLPYTIMILLGMAIFWESVGASFWQWLSAVGYLVYGVLGVLWIMLRVCPYCHFHGTDSCPCGYGRISARLRAKQDGEDFARRFQRHIPAIVPLWFLPPVAGGIAMYDEFSWTLAVLLAAFALNSYAVLPLVSKRYGCTRCPQKETCPWMGGCR